MTQFEYADQIRYARERFLGNGEVPEGILSESIYRSWERCVNTGLAIDLSVQAEPADVRLLTELKQKNTQLLHQSQVEMENLYSHIQGTQSMVILSDAEGTILHALGDSDFMTKAQRVALQPGVSWREDVTGTNAIGTALVEQAPVFVMGAEHYCERNGFLNCSAAPIVDPYGKIIGVLDLSGDHRQPQEHTMALVRMSAQMIENRLFNEQFSGEITVRFHSRAEFLHTIWEGIAVFSLEGYLLAANRSGLFQLGLNNMKQIGVPFEQLFDVSLHLFLDATHKKLANTHTTLTLRNGVKLFAKVDPGLHKAIAVKSSPETPQAHKSSETAALDALLLGDAAVQKTVEKAKLAIGHDIPILIEGETGTGKELLARAIHQSSLRRQGQFVAINCAAIPEGLIESELFGHEEGAFTGSRRRGAVGRIQQAHGGTLFLDEVGDMPLMLQARLLRVIQEREVMPLGGGKAVAVDVCVISATNCRLKQKVEKGEFREDLYYRLNGLRLTLPALRVRTDLEALITQILKQQLNKPKIVLHPDVLKLMRQHPWPGNVRQLSHVLRSAIISMRDDELGLEHLPEDFLEESVVEQAGFSGSQNLSNNNPDNQNFEPIKMTNIADAEEMLIKQALEHYQGNMVAVAKVLGISRATLYRKSRQFGLR
jgi:sigma-54 dependent transcriptional regulator, acetoin dehydrogenase operon transcriptional activator AcoR